MSNSLIYFLSNRTGGSYTICYRMLKKYCKNEAIARKKTVMKALTDYIQYLCSIQGKEGDLIIMCLLYYSIMLLWYRDKLADELATNIISWLLSHISNS